LRVVEDAVGAEVCVLKVVNVVEEHGPGAVCSSLSDSRALSASGAAKAAASVASEHPWPGAPFVAGAAFEVVTVLDTAISASARCCRFWAVVLHAGASVAVAQHLCALW
jgi:hypothetical protein